MSLSIDVVDDKILPISRRSQNKKKDGNILNNNKHQSSDIAAVVTPTSDNENESIPSAPTEGLEDNVVVEENEERGGSNNSDDGDGEEGHETDSNGNKWPLRVSKGMWTVEEDEILSNAVNSNHGICYAMLLLLF